MVVVVFMVVVVVVVMVVGLCCCCCLVVRSEPGHKHGKLETQHLPVGVWGFHNFGFRTK